MGRLLSCLPRSIQGPLGWAGASGVHILLRLNLQMGSSQWTESHSSSRNVVSGPSGLRSTQVKKVDRCVLTLIHTDWLENNVNTFHGSVFTHCSSSYFCKSFWGKPWKGLMPVRPCAWLPVVPAWNCHQVSLLTSLLRALSYFQLALERKKKENARSDGDCHLLSLLQPQDFIWNHETVCGLQVLATAFCVSWKKLYFGLALASCLLQSYEVVRATSAIDRDKTRYKDRFPNIHGYLETDTNKYSISVHLEKQTMVSMWVTESDQICC